MSKVTKKDITNSKPVGSIQEAKGVYVFLLDGKPYVSSPSLALVSLAAAELSDYITPDPNCLSNSGDWRIRIQESWAKIHNEDGLRIEG